MLSNEIEECLNLCTNEFKAGFATSSYEQTADLSKSIMDLTKALSCQIQIERLTNNESEEK